MIGERIPLELLSRRPLTPPQLAEIQVVLSSRPVATLAFAFCHLLHWVTFGQTRRDRPEDRTASDAGGCSCTTATGSILATSVTTVPASASIQQNALVQAFQKMNNSQMVLSREERILHRGQEILRRGMAALAAEQRSPASKQVVPQVPEGLEEEMHRLRGQFGVLQSALQSHSDCAIRAAEDFDRFEVPLDTLERRLKALAVAETAYKITVEKIKVCKGKCRSSTWHGRAYVSTALATWE